MHIQIYKTRYIYQIYILLILVTNLSHTQHPLGPAAQDYHVAGSFHPHRRGVWRNC